MNQEQEKHLSTQPVAAKRVIGQVTRASGLGGAFGLVVGYIVANYLFPNAPSEIQDAVTYIILFAGVYVGGWLVKPGTGTRRG